MTQPLERAAARLNALQSLMPDAVLLARVSSLAVRIEPYLLRRLRLELLPDADVGSEADVWFSSIVESRGTTAVVLQQHVTTLLRDSLATDRALLARAADITSAAHTHLSSVLQLEESVTALALLDREAAVDRIDEAFKPVLRALKEDDERALEMARWMLRAAPRFPPVVWQSSVAYSLLHASSVLLGGRRILEDVPQAVSADLDAIAWALPASVREERVSVGVELLPAALQFSAPIEGSVTIELPPTTPPVVEVRWVRDKTAVRVLVDPVPGRVVDIGPDVDTLTLRTVAGDVFTIEREAAPEPSFTDDVFISHSSHETERAAQLANVLSRQGLQVFIDIQQISGGQRFGEQIERAIRGSRVIIVLWSEAAAASERVRREVALGLERDAVIPVLLDRTRLPPELIRYQALDLTLWNGSESDPELEPLLQAVLQLLEPERPAEPGRPAVDGWKPEQARILEPTGMEEACVRILDSRGHYATGFYLAPRIVVTAAEPFAGKKPGRLELALQRGDYEEEVRVVNEETREPVLLLETRLANTEPLRLVTAVTRRPSMNVVEVPSTARVIVAFGDGTKAVAARAQVLHDKSDSFEIDLPERNLPQEFFGAPVIIGNGVAGIVTGVQTSVFPQSTLRVTGAVVLESLVRGSGRERAPAGGFTRGATAVESAPGLSESSAAPPPPPRPSREQRKTETPEAPTPVTDHRGESKMDMAYESPQYGDVAPPRGEIPTPSAEQPRGLGQRIRDAFGGLFGGRRRPADDKQRAESTESAPTRPASADRLTPDRPSRRSNRMPPPPDATRK